MHMRARLLAVATLTVVFVVFVSTTGVAQALMVQLPLAKVTRLSPRVVVADVLSVKAVGVSTRGGDSLKTIKTVVRLKVVDQVKGAGAHWITLRVPGGRVGDVGLVVEDTARFVPGTRCIVFLDGHGGVTGWRQGVLNVVDGQVVELDRPVSAVTRGIRAAAGGAQPRSLEPVAKDVRLATIEPMMSALLPASPVAPAATTRAHSNLISDGFESTFGWTTSGTPTWANTTYRNNGGTQSAYCAQSTTAAPGPYPNSMNAWMFKTVDLSDATIAVLDFDVWFVMASGDAWFCLLSTDGSSWGTVGGYGGSTGGWWHWSVDLRNAAAAGGGTRNYCGQSTVYIAFVAQSNASVTAEGAYMDNVVLWKDTAAVPSITSMTPTSGSAGTGTHVTIAGTGFGPGQGTGSVQFFYRSSTTITAPITSWSDTSIDCTIPTGIIDSYPASAGSGPVKVIDNNGNWNVPYSYTVTFGYGGVKWASPGVTYRYNANTADIANETALIDAGWATWFPWSAFTFTKGTTCTTSTYPAPHDANNDIYWAASGFPAGVLGVNQYWYSGSTISESDIAFNDAFTWSDGAVIGAYDVQTVATHESGHSLNLRDLYGPGDTGDVMYGSTASNSTKRSLSSDDQAGILWIYGAAFSGTMGINSGATYTNSTSVTLGNSATATQMHFRDGAGTFGSFEAYGATRSWTLPAGDGTKTVEAQYLNAAGKYSAVASDTIILDQTAPVTTDNSDGLPHVMITLAFSPSDALSGVAFTEYRVDGGGWVSGTGVTLRHAIRHKRGGYSRGAHTVDYRSTDNAGNVETFKSRVVTLS